MRHLFHLGNIEVTEYVALGFPKLPRQDTIDKGGSPAAEAISADLKDNGFTLANLRWLKKRVADSRPRSQQIAQNIGRKEVDPVMGTSRNQRQHVTAKAAGKVTHGELNQLVN